MLNLLLHFEYMEDNYRNHLMSLCASYIIYIFESVSTDWFSPHYRLYFLLGIFENFCFDVECWEFCRVGFWLLLYFYK